MLFNRKSNKQFEIKSLFTSTLHLIVKFHSSHLIDKVLRREHVHSRKDISFFETGNQLASERLSIILFSFSLHFNRTAINSNFIGVIKNVSNDKRYSTSANKFNHPIYIPLSPFSKR